MQIVPVKRLLSFLIVTMSAFGIVWAMTVWTAAPAASGTGEAEPPAYRSVEFDIADAAPIAGGTIDYARIDARLRRVMDDPAMVGLAVGIVEDGRIRFLQGYGETSLGGGDPVTTATVFRWASLSKGVAGDMIALLAAEGRIGLNDPVARYTTTLRLPGGNEASVTVADLLAHRTGLFAHAQDNKLEDGQDPRTLRAELAALAPICPPNTCHAYQNVAFDAAAEIVERLTGESYEAVVHRNLFAPAGMRSASISRAGLQNAASWARPHIGGRNPRMAEVNENYYRVPAAGGVNGSIEDLTQWMLAQMGGASGVIPANVLAAAHAPRVATPGEDRRRRKYGERTTGSGYGLGWRSFDYAGHRVVGHHGGVMGYRSMILFDPARRSGVVALWNASNNVPAGLEYEVMDMVYRLPFRDWLELDTPRGGAAAQERPENEGGNS